MAASDPTTDVPTPTGTLQGVAAFSWDGSAWQPAGPAGPSVATPTGVLRGVAAFNGGPAWQPSGLAQPGVATPTGTLDGVAVYTWSGAAWTPTGGTATPSTPSGALRGVAAFNWDGAAWQPAGQAGPSVATPYGVLDGVAMFNWSGSAWAAVGAPTLSLDFMQPGALPPGMVFTRASTATYFDSAGVIQTAAVDTPRWDYNPTTHALNGIWIEEARTNLLLNSATLGTQSVAVTAQAYTLSFYGTGTVTLSGASTAGPLVGTGAFPQRVTLTFTPTAGTLTCTVTGSVLNAQLEAGGFGTSYTPTTGATVTRAMDVLSIPLGALYVVGIGTLYIEALQPVTISKAVTLINLGAGVRVAIILTAGNSVNMFDSAAPINVALLAAEPIGVPFKAAFGFRVGSQRGVVNGGTIVSATAGTVANPSSPPIYPGSQGNGQMNGYVRHARYWNRMLTDAELQSVTT